MQVLTFTDLFKLCIVLHSLALVKDPSITMVPAEQLHVWCWIKKKELLVGCADGAFVEPKE